MTVRSKQFCVAIVAGEASGDQHGARLVKAMQGRHAGLFFCGMGGPALKQAGVRIVVDAAGLTVVGITEVVAKLPNILKGMATIKKLLQSLTPDLLVLIDFPDFNLHIATVAKKLGIPVLYYISPQIWAWRRGRVKRIAKRVDHMAVILPFEQPFYREHNVPATFVGHPLMDADLPATDRNSHRCLKNGPVIGLVPGSRDTEIARHLPVMLEAADLLERRLERAAFMVSHAPSVARPQIDAVIERHYGQARIEVVSDGVEKIFERCDAIVAASGTVTLQAAIHGTPMVIVYKVSPISYWLGRALIRVPHIGLVNLVAGERIIPELIQHEASAENIAAELQRMLGDADSLNHLRQRLFALRNVLGSGGASERVADLALGMLKNQPGDHAE